jgi:hypothetical protein
MLRGIHLTMRWMNCSASLAQPQPICLCWIGNDKILAVQAVGAAELFRYPTAKMTAGGMPPVDMPPDDLKALIAYVESLKQPDRNSCSRKPLQSRLIGNYQAGAVDFDWLLALEISKKPGFAGSP